MVKTSYANIYAEPSFSSEMVTQAIFFESLEILSEHGNWYKISQWDGYEGYVHKFYLGEANDESADTVILSDRLTPIYSSQDDQSISLLAPFGASLSCRGDDDGWMSIEIDSDSYYLKTPKEQEPVASRDLVVKYCGRLLGSPYLWGGKTPLGYDCSGFVQSVYRAIGVGLERDTSKQINDTQAASINLSDAKPGDLIFFSIEGSGVDHVGIWIGENNVAHCGGQVKIQSIHDDANTKLIDYITDVKSMESYLNG